MNTVYLDAAKERINNVPLLVNLVSRRVRQLNRGQRPLVKADNMQMSKMDLALKEIGEGLLTAEMGFSAADQMPKNDEKIITL